MGKSKEAGVGQIQITRRDFGKLGLLAFAHVFDSNIKHDRSETEEASKLGYIFLNRQDLDLEVINPNTNQERQLQEAWNNYHIWDFPSPKISEGWGTDFGPAAVAIGQLMVHTDMLRQEGAEGTRERTLLALRDDVERLLSRQNISADQIERGFKRLINRYGFDCVVAMKAPQDFGRTGLVSEWNYISEEWSEPLRAIVLNTATQATFNGLYDTQKPLANYSENGEENTPMRWTIEVSDETHTKSGLPIGRVGRHYRWMENDIERENVIIMPKYELKHSYIHPEFSHLSQRIRQTITAKGFRYRLHTQARLGEVLPEGFVYSVDNYDYDDELRKQNFMTYLMYQEGIPVYRDNGNIQLREDMTALANSEVRTGFPLGTISFYDMANLFLQGRNWERTIISSTTNPVTKDIFGGFYFTEQFGDDANTQQMTDWGIVTRAGGTLNFITLDENRRFIVHTENDMKRITDEIILRVSIFH